MNDFLLTYRSNLDLSCQSYQTSNAFPTWALILAFISVLLWEIPFILLSRVYFMMFSASRILFIFNIFTSLTSFQYSFHDFHVCRVQHVSCWPVWSFKIGGQNIFFTSSYLLLFRHAVIYYTNSWFILVIQFQYEYNSVITPKNSITFQ